MGFEHNVIAEGDLLANKYRVQRVLGQGGMGVVVAAHHLVLDQDVAVKFLLPSALQSTAAIARFEREARAAAKIQSEHVARVMDVGRLENGAPYLVMELLRGRDLDAILRQQGPLPLSLVADYVLQAGEALAEAHQLGVVHRDLKPSNLFLADRADGSSCIKVLDFGISKVSVAGPDDQSLTSTDTVIGSPLYMSPEQLMSARDVDQRTDIWSLGVICFELLAGKPPFLADSLPQLCMSISLGLPTPLRSYRPDVPPEVEAMVLRCLSKDPGARYASVAELAAELVKFAPLHAKLSAERIERVSRASRTSEAAPALPVGPSSPAPAESGTGSRTIDAFGRTRAGLSPSEAPRRFGARASLGLGALLIAGGASAFLLSRPHLPTPPAALSSTVFSAAPAPIESTTPMLTALPVSADPAPIVDAGAPATVQSGAPSAGPVSLPPSNAVPVRVKANVPPVTPVTPAKPTIKLEPSSAKKPTLGGRL